MKRRNAYNQGNVLIIILVGISLFAALAYAFTQNSRSNVALMTNEMTHANQIHGEQCSQALNAARKRLTLRGCAVISSDTKIEDITDPKCGLYHPEGGGLMVCAALTTATCGTAPSVGTKCPDGTVYAGISPDGNKHMYTTPSDGGFMAFGAGTAVDTPMPNCNGSGGSCITGRNNTELLATLGGVGAPYNAALYCAALSAHGYDDWYLPAKGEVDLLFNGQNAIGNFNQTGNWTSGYYITSSEHNASEAWVLRMDTSYDPHTRAKNITFSFRCVRKDP
jgi:hypothetical protein